MSVPVGYETLDQITQRYPVCLETLRYWIKLGKLPAFKPGRRVLVRRADIDAIIEAAPIGAVRATRARARRKAAARVTP